MPGFARILVTLETDPRRYHGEKPRPPGQPGQAACEQLLAHLLTDLEKIFPAIRDFSVAMPGALYDQTQVLRPGFPVFSDLQHALAAMPGSGLLALEVGVPDDGSREVQAPDPTIQPGLLQNLPLLISGEHGALETMSEDMEHRFLQEGQLSAHSARALEAHFGVAVQHARFMTLTDLRAMLKLQLEHFGFSGLWTLLDAALENTSEPVSIEGRNGQRFEYADGKVIARFESFDFWARRGAGRALDGGDALASAYVDWTREYRQFITTLEAHRVPLCQRPASPECSRVEGDYLVEESRNGGRAGALAEVTEHGTDEVGVIAVTVLESGRQLNFYPLSASGLDTLHRSIRRRGLGPAGFSYPGRVLHDPQTRTLVPDTDA